MLNPIIELEKLLKSQIYEALHGELVEKVLALSSYNGMGDNSRGVMEGHSFKVERRLMSHMYDLLYEVKEKLGFEEPVDFYITGDSSVNAYTMSAVNEGEPHIVNLNSALLNLMSDDEIRFVVGHELGHLMNKDVELLRLIGFVFPHGTVPPVVLQYKIRLWEQLAELVADRFGFMAVPSLDTCVSSFFKLTSGLNINKIDMQVDVYLEENLKRLEYFINDKGLNTGSHPVNPMRVQALNLYATCTTEEELTEKMDVLINSLVKITNSELDYYMAYFVASAGLIAANIDEKVTDREIEMILSQISNFQMFPRSFLEHVNSQNVGEVFMTSVKKIMEIDPGMRDPMFGYLISLVLSDSSFNDGELQFLFEIGENCFGFSKKEIADRMAVSIQRNFVPSYEKIF